MATTGQWIPTRGGYTRTRVTVQNTGTERWGYPGQIYIRYRGGRDDETYLLEGASGVRVDLPRGLRPGESADVLLEMPNALATQFYYTADVQIESEYDDNRRNSKIRAVLFVEADGRVTVSGSDTMRSSSATGSLTSSQSAQTAQENAQGKVLSKSELLKLYLESQNR